MILRALALAFGQLPDPRLQKVILSSVVASLIALFGLIWAIGKIISGLFNGTEFWLPLIGTVDLAPLGIGAQILGGLFLSAFLMVPITQGIQSLFLDQIADAVEARHYPALPPDRDLPYISILGEALRGVLLLLFVNAIALIFYIIFAPIAPLLFCLVNGFLLGREYFLVVALRRSDRAEIQELRRQHRLTIWGAGVVMAFGLTIPLLNLIVPVLGAACFTHIYHGLARHS